MTILELSKKRRSVRTFDGNQLKPEDLAAITECAESAENPYRMAIDWSILDSSADNLKCPVISGTDCYIAGKLRLAPHAEEAFGYSFEKVVLTAIGMGIGTTWIGGTMDRAAFERAAGVEEGEFMPAVSPLGYPAHKMAIKESLMRKGVKADSRMSLGEICFVDDFSKPMQNAGELAGAIESVRLAPSAVNKQPWRLVKAGNTVHFYEKRSKGYVTKAGWDMQKLDMGIAMYHFAASLQEMGIGYEFSLEEPAIPHDEDMIYIASYIIK